MSLYKYIALSQDGKKVQGTLEAASVVAVKNELLRKKFFVVKIELDSKKGKESFWSFLFEKPVDFKEIIFFTKQLSVLLRSGVPLVNALDLLSEQFKGKLRTIISNLIDGIKEGKSLADGLAKYPAVFEKIYVQLVKAGEASGKLEFILERLTTYLERSSEVKGKVSKAMSKPLTQLGIIGLVVIGLMTKVLPNLTKMLVSNSKEIPTMTKILMASSDFLLNHYLALLISLAFLIVSFLYFKSTKKGKFILDYLKLKIPLFNVFSKVGAIVQFCSTLGMLLESGVNLPPALDIVCNIVDNSILISVLEKAKEKIVKQGKITPFLKETGIFPEMAIYLIRTGEETGRLDFMLLTVARNYEVELFDLADSLTEKIEPLMTMIMAVVVGGIMFAVMGPIMSSYEMMG